MDHTGYTGHTDTGDDRALIGHWGRAPFDLGAMETSDVEFLADGRGRSSLLNAFDEHITRFRWHCPEPGVVEVREEDGTATRHHYRIEPTSPLPGAPPVTTVHFDEPLAFSHQFAKSG